MAAKQIGGSAAKPSFLLGVAAMLGCAAALQLSEGLGSCCMCQVPPHFRDGRGGVRGHVFSYEVYPVVCGVGGCIGFSIHKAEDRCDKEALINTMLNNYKSMCANNRLLNGYEERCESTEAQNDERSGCLDQHIIFDNFFGVTTGRNTNNAYYAAAYKQGPLSNRLGLREGLHAQALLEFLHGEKNGSLYLSNLKAIRQYRFTAFVKTAATISDLAVMKEAKGWFCLDGKTRTKKCGKPEPPPGVDDDVCLLLDSLIESKRAMKDATKILLEDTAVKDTQQQAQKTCKDFQEAKETFADVKEQIKALDPDSDPSKEEQEAVLDEVLGDPCSGFLRCLKKYGDTCLTPKGIMKKNGFGKKLQNTFNTLELYAGSVVGHEEQLREQWEGLKQSLEEFQELGGHREKGEKKVYNQIKHVPLLQLLQLLPPGACTTGGTCTTSIIAGLVEAKCCSGQNEEGGCTPKKERIQCRNQLMQRLLVLIKEDESLRTKVMPNLPRSFTEYIGNLDEECKKITFDTLMKEYFKEEQGTCEGGEFFY